MPLQLYKTFPHVRSTLLQLYKTFPHVRSTLLQLYKTFPHARSMPLQLYKTFPHAGSKLLQLYKTSPHAGSTLLRLCKTFPHVRKCFCKLAKPSRTSGSASANLQKHASILLTREMGTIKHCFLTNNQATILYPFFAALREIIDHGLTHRSQLFAIARNGRKVTQLVRVFG